MPGRGRPKITVRMDPQLWERFRLAAEAAGTDRATLIRRLIQEYVRRWEASQADV